MVIEAWSQSNGREVDDAVLKFKDRLWGHEPRNAVSCGIWKIPKNESPLKP